MRREKKVQLQNQSITLFEITPRVAVELKPVFARFMETGNWLDVAKEVPGVIAKISDAKIEELLDLGFSEIDVLEAAFREVNSSFLRRLDQAWGVTKRLELDQVLKEIVASMRENIREAMQNLSQEGQLTPQG